MAKALVILALMALVCASVAAETPAEKAKRMKWFKEARFGMFIHWGLYSIPAGKWGDSNRHAEWIRETAHIPVTTYEQFQAQFNPVKFNADEWMSLAQGAGVQYVVITTKHHDGFCLFDSKLTTWDVMDTPYKKDIMADIANSARSHNLVPCWYHSIMDWHHPDYLPRRSWEAKDRPVGDANFDRYIDYLHGQVTELLTNYGPIGLMWFDGEWESTWNHRYGQPLYDLCRKLQPNVIVNNRVDVGRGGMGGMSDAGFAGDYGTPEQEVPATGLPSGVYWESCITMNGNWGYNAADKNYKSFHDMIALLVDVVSKGGNLLLNVGPKPDGTLPDLSIQRLREIGSWMKVNGEAIHGTDASPFKKNPDWWRCTRKGKSLYIHLLTPPAEGKVVLPGLSNKIRKATVMGGGEVTARRSGTDVVLNLSSLGERVVPVVRLDLEGEPLVYEEPSIAAPSDVLVDTLTVSLKGPKGLEYRFTTDGSEPKASSSKYSRPFTIKKAATIKARGFANGQPVTAVSTRRFEKVTPMAPVSADTVPGLNVSVVPGDFDTCAAMLAAAAGPKQPIEALSLGKLGAKEHVGLIFDGYMKAPKTGVYQLSLLSDDGSRLYIGDKLAIDHDGLHGPTEKTAFIALGAGLHRLRLEWFNKTGGYELNVNWALAGETLKPLKEVFR